jgi:hypothetical protein
MKSVVKYNIFEGKIEDGYLLKKRFTNIVKIILITSEDTMGKEKVKLPFLTKRSPGRRNSGV